MKGTWRGTPLPEGPMSLPGRERALFLAGNFPHGVPAAVVAAPQRE